MLNFISIAHTFEIGIHFNLILMQWLLLINSCCQVIQWLFAKFDIFCCFCLKCRWCVINVLLYRRNIVYFSQIDLQVGEIKDSESIFLKKICSDYLIYFPSCKIYFFLPTEDLIVFLKTFYFKWAIYIVFIIKAKLSPAGKNALTFTQMLKITMFSLYKYTIMQAFLWLR